MRGGDEGEGGGEGVDGEEMGVREFGDWGGGVVLGGG